MEIKILGPGCQRCTDVEKLIINTVAEMNIAADIEKVSDMQKIASYGVFTTPSVVVNGVVKCSGRVPKKEEIIKWVTI